MFWRSLLRMLPYHCNQCAIFVQMNNRNSIQDTFSIKAILKNAPKECSQNVPSQMFVTILINSKAYSEPRQTSKIELFC